MKLNRRTAVVASIVAVACVALVIFLMRAESFDHAGERLTVAIEHGDADTVMDFISDADQEQAGTTKPVLAKLLGEYYLPKLSGFRRTYTDRAKTGLYASIYSQCYEHSDGRKTAITYPLQRDGKKIYARRLLGELVLTAMRTEWPADLPYPMDSRRKTFFLEAISKDQAQLERIGLKGIDDDAPEDTFAFYTWQEFRTKLEDSLRKQAEHDAIPH